METIGRIRREHFVRGKSIKEIVRELKVSRNTVRKVLRSGATSFAYMRVVLGDLLSAEIAEKQARSIKYLTAIARLPLAEGTARLRFYRYADQ